MRDGGLEHAIHLAGRLADAQAADGIAGKVELGQRRGTFARGGRHRARLARWRTAPDRRAGPRRGSVRPSEPSRSQASRTTAGSLGSSTTWSSTIATSLPSASWMATARSGEMANGRPSICERKTASCSVTFEHVRQAEDLKAAAIGEDRAVPAHEGVQTAQLGHDLFARPQREVIGVGQHHLGAGAAELLDLQSLDRGQRADRHEGRHLHRAVRRDEGRAASSGSGIGMVEMEGKGHGTKPS